MRVSLSSLIEQLNVDTEVVLESQTHEELIQRIKQRFHQFRTQTYEEENTEELEYNEPTEPNEQSENIDSIFPQPAEVPEDDISTPVFPAGLLNKKFKIFHDEDEDEDEKENPSKIKAESPDISKNGKVTTIDGFVFGLPDVEEVPTRRKHRYGRGNKQHQQSRPWEVHRDQPLGKRNWKEDLELQMYDQMVPESNMERPRYNPNSKFLTSRARKVDMPLLTPWTDVNCPGRYSRDSRGMPTYCGAVPEAPQVVCRLPAVQMIQLPTIGGDVAPEPQPEEQIDWEAEYPFDITTETIFEVMGNVLPVDQYLTYRVLDLNKEVVKRTQMRSLIIDALVDGIGVVLTDQSVSDDQEEGCLAELDSEERQLLRDIRQPLSSLQQEVLREDFVNLAAQHPQSKTLQVKKEPGDLTFQEPHFGADAGFNEFGVPESEEGVVGCSRRRQLQSKVVDAVLADPEFVFLHSDIRYTDAPTVCTGCGFDDHHHTYCPERFPYQCKMCLGTHYKARCPMIVCFRCNGVGHRSADCRVAAKSLQQLECMRCGSFNHKYEDCMRLLDSAWGQQVPDMGLIKCVVCGIPGHTGDTHLKEGVWMEKEEEFSSTRNTKPERVMVVLKKLGPENKPFEIIRHDYRTTGSYNVEAFDEFRKVQFYEDEEELDEFDTHFFMESQLQAVPEEIATNN